jgi:Putative prokaryotic signal transducing protein
MKSVLVIGRASEFVRAPRARERAFVPECISGGTTMKPSDLVVVSTFPSTADARIAKGVLDGVAIESMIRSDNAGGMYPAIGGADLLVRAEDVEKAQEALQRRHSPR